MVSTTIDPDGRRVVLTEERWEHIKERHAILATRLREIMSAVREPTRRTHGHGDNEECFWSDEPFDRLWLQVVVHYEGGEGWIATAFPRESPPRP
jgi:hypothetical protein